MNHIDRILQEQAEAQLPAPFHMQIHKLHIITETEYHTLKYDNAMARELRLELTASEAKCRGLTSRNEAHEIEIDTLSQALEARDNIIAKYKADVAQRELYAVLDEQNRELAEKLDQEKVLTAKSRKKKVLTPEQKSIDTVSIKTEKY